MYHGVQWLKTVIMPKRQLLRGAYSEQRLFGASDTEALKPGLSLLAEPHKASVFTSGRADLANAWIGNCN